MIYWTAVEKIQKKMHFLLSHCTKKMGWVQRRAENGGESYLNPHRKKEVTERDEIWRR